MRSWLFITVAVAGVTLVACNGSDTPTASSEVSVMDDEEADPGEDELHWAEGEQEATFVCASEKLGYEFTQETIDDFVGYMSESESEAAWEQERQSRAYEQCIFEVKIAEIDMSLPHWQWMYRHAYGLDPDGNPVRADPLAPWPGESARDE